MEIFTFPSSDGSDITVRRWLPSKEPILGLIQIAHGMAEHAGRYAWFAETLNDHGLAVYANDHRGHGLTAGRESELGFFAEDQGWDRVVEDMKALSDRIRTDHPGLPLFLFGHSMGSFLSRDYIARFGGSLAGAILSGTSGPPGVLGQLGLMMAKLQALTKGPRAPSPLMDKLSFGSFVKSFKPERTPFDWLSRDNRQVDAYIEDPLCGFICSAGFYKDLISGVIKVNRQALFDQTPTTLPMLMFSGSMDPVGNFTKGVRQAHAAYQKAGVADLTLRFYDQSRHETLNEINRDQVAADVIAWIIPHLAGS